MLCVFLVALRSGFAATLKCRLPAIRTREFTEMRSPECEASFEHLPTEITEVLADYNFVDTCKEMD